MTALAAKPAAKADPLEVFIARAEARAYLWREGEFDLHEAVDRAAGRRGADRPRRRDRSRRGAGHHGRAFAAVRADADADVVPDLDRAGDLDQQKLPKRGAVAKSTIDAAEYLVRQGDADRLRRWLHVHSAEERIAIRKHLEATRCPRSAQSR